jgi:DNA-binding transcriptional LysR family regulator
MSASLARLRKALGDELFIRAQGAMMPTPRALRLAPGIRVALAQLDETLTEHTPFDPKASKHTFTLASTDYTSFVLAAPLARMLGTLAPNVDLRIVGYDKNDIPELLLRGAIDVALGTFRPPPDRAVRKALYIERFVGLARRHHPALRRGRMSVEAWLAAPHALVSVRRDARGAVDDALAARGLKRRTALVLPHMLVLPRILQTSDLVASVPARLADEVAGVELTAFELPIAVPSWTVEMLWTPATRKDRAAAWLRARIVEVASRLT